MKGTTPAARSAETNKPVRSFRLHGISIAVFANKVEHEDQELTFWKVAVQKTYRDGDNGFKTTSSYDADEVPTLLFLLSKAYAFIADELMATKSEKE